MNNENTYDEIEDALIQVLEAFTEEHEHLTIDSEVVGDILAVRIQAHASDTGRIIGDKGGMIKAIQKVFAQIGITKTGAPVKIRLLEPEVGSRRHYPPFKDDPNWPKDKIVGIFETLADLAYVYPVEMTLHEGTDFAMIQIDIANDEPAQDDLEDALTVLAKAIGKANGRILHVEVKKITHGNR